MSSLSAAVVLNTLSFNEVNRAELVRPGFVETKQRKKIVEFSSKSHFDSERKFSILSFHKVINGIKIRCTFRHIPTIGGLYFEIETMDGIEMIPYSNNTWPAWLRRRAD